MLKKFLIFSCAVWLCACAGGNVRKTVPTARPHKRVNFFTDGRTQAAFKVVGQMNEDYVEGVLRVKKIGEADYDVVLMTGAAYRVLHATVSPERRVKGDVTTVTYQGKDAKERFFYRAEELYPYAAQSVTLLNTADLTYGEYAPAGPAGEEQVPHSLVYKDGNITLDLTLISLR